MTSPAGAKISTTSPTFFTVIADYKSVVADAIQDVDFDPELGPITAKVTFTPMLADGSVILATKATPRPTGFIAAPIVGRIDTDGVLKLRVDPDGTRQDCVNKAAFPATGKPGYVYHAIDNKTYWNWDGTKYVETRSYTPIRLLADTPFLELASPLFYKVDFSEVVLNGRPGIINSFTFQAPNSDLELDLIGVAVSPGVLAGGITKIAPGGVRMNSSGQIVFTFGGVDLPDPITLSAVSASGPAGPTGPAGPKGDKGDKGDTGGTSVAEFPNKAGFPAVGAANVLYVDADTNEVFRWDGKAYVALSAVDATTFGKSLIKASDAAAARTVIGAERSYRYNVLDHGLVADSPSTGGGTDNSAALAALMAKAQEGSEIYFPITPLNMRYGFGSQIVVDKSLKFSGDWRRTGTTAALYGSLLSFLTPAAQLAAGSLIRVKSHRVEIDGLVLRGKATKETAGTVTINGTTVQLSSLTATPAMVGARVSGPLIPAETTVSAVDTAANTVTLSKPAAGEAIKAGYSDTNGLSIFFNGDHDLAAGDEITLSGFTPAAWNGTFSVSIVSDWNAIQVLTKANPGTATKIGTYTARRKTSEVWFGADGLEFSGPPTTNWNDQAHICRVSHMYIDNSVQELCAAAPTIFASMTAK